MAERYNKEPHISAPVRGTGPLAARQFADYQCLPDEDVETLSCEDLAAAAVVSQALELAGDPDKELAFDPSRRFLSKAWRAALDRGKASTKLRWSESTVRSTNAILALIRALGAFISAQGDEEALEEALDAEATQAFEAGLSALELLQTSLLMTRSAAATCAKLRSSTLNELKSAPWLASR